MLQFIREKAQGWISWVIIGILSFTFALWGIQNYSASNADPNILAKVNGVPITRHGVQAQYQRLQQAWLEKSRVYSFDEKVQHHLQEQALEQLITSQVLLQAAAQDGFFLSPRLLGETVISMPYFQKEGKFSNEQYEGLLARMGYSRESFLAELEQSILLSQIKFGILESALVFPNEPAYDQKEYELYIKSKMDKAKIVRNAK